MAKNPYMPLYVTDYLKDTTRLSCEEHGAYMLLMMDYWTNGPLPDDDKILSQIVKLDIRKWRKIKPVLLQFFDKIVAKNEQNLHKICTKNAAILRHARIDKEMQKSIDISTAKSEAASKASKARWGKKEDAERNPSGNAQWNPSGNAQGNPSVMPSHTHIHSNTHSHTHKKQQAANADGIKAATAFLGDSGELDVGLVIGRIFEIRKKASKKPIPSKTAYCRPLWNEYDDRGDSAILDWLAEIQEADEQIQKQKADENEARRIAEQAEIRNQQVARDKQKRSKILKAYSELPDEERRTVDRLVLSSLGSSQKNSRFAREVKTIEIMEMEGYVV